MIFLEYPRCISCRNAKKWLDENGIDYSDRNIAKENPSSDELNSWIKLSGLPVERFFNTNGAKYRELGLKEKLGTMSYKEKIELLSKDGMTVKRPLLIGDDFVLVGFKTKEWEEKLK